MQRQRLSVVGPAIALLIVIVFAAGAARAAEAAKARNVLFLLADDQRPDTIGALGNPVIKTPNLDKLAERGFVFHNAYCMGSTMGAVKQVFRVGTPAQQAKAVEILTDARKRLYQVLASDEA